MNTFVGSGLGVPAAGGLLVSVSITRAAEFGLESVATNAASVRLRHSTQRSAVAAITVRHAMSGNAVPVSASLTRSSEIKTRSDTRHKMRLVRVFP